MTINRNPLRILALTAAATALVLGSCAGPRSIRRHLDGLDLAWEIDPEGDIRVTVPMDDGSETTVGIAAHTLEAAPGVRMREIWSVAARIPGDFPEGLAEDLMEDSWSSRLTGSWALAGRTSDGRAVLIYLVKIPGDASRSVLSAALRDAAETASEMKKALSSLENSG